MSFGAFNDEKTSADNYQKQFTANDKLCYKDIKNNWKRGKKKRKWMQQLLKRFYNVKKLDLDLQIDT